MKKVGDQNSRTMALLIGIVWTLSFYEKAIIKMAAILPVLFSNGWQDRDNSNFLLNRQIFLTQLLIPILISKD